MTIEERFSQHLKQYENVRGVNVVDRVRDYAVMCHESTNHRYDNHAYSVHLEMVVKESFRFSHLIKKLGDLETIVCACWCHDVIEDTRQTYNDVNQNVGYKVAEIVYALSNEKGKSRKERANAEYYAGIRNLRFAWFVKLCDRLANIRYSVENGSRMSDVYRREHSEFKKELYCSEYKEMFEEMEKLLEI